MNSTGRILASERWLAEALASARTLLAIMPFAWTLAFLRPLIERLVPKLARTIGMTIVWIAFKRLERTAPNAPRNIYPDTHKTSHTRLRIGSELRDALRHRNLATRVARLMAIATNPEAHIAKMMARLQRGFARRLGGVLPQTTTPLLTSPAIAPDAANSS